MLPHVDTEVDGFKFRFNSREKGLAYGWFVGMILHVVFSVGGTTPLIGWIAERGSNVVMKLRNM